MRSQGNTFFPDYFHNRFFFLLFLICMLIMPKKYVFAEHITETVDGNDTSVYYLKSDGETDGERTINTDAEINRSNDDSVQYSQSEKNAIDTKKSIRDILSGWRMKVQNTEEYKDKFWLTTYDAINIAIGDITASDAKSLVESVKKLQTETRTDASWVNRNIIPSAGEKEESVDGISRKEKHEILAEIVRQESPISGIWFDDDLVRTEISNNHPEYNFHYTPLHLIIRDDKEKPYIQNGETVRTDIYPGYPPMRDTTTYTNRFNPLISEVVDNGWDQSGSVYMNDTVNISMLTDYHLYSVVKDYVTQTEYVSNERRWTITKDGTAIGDPVITDDPRHELNFTEVYKDNGAGEYHVVAEQIADIKKSTFAQYDICEYLYETDTGAVLWYNEKMVRNGMGGSIYLNTVTSREWVETGDTFDITINDLGEIEKEGSGTQREE